MNFDKVTAYLLRQNITNFNAFRLRDIDGVVQISVWDYNIPQPTIEQLLAISDENINAARSIIKEQSRLTLDNVKIVNALTNQLAANKTFSMNNGLSTPLWIYTPIHTTLVSIIITTPELIEDMLIVNLIITVSTPESVVEHYPFNVPKIKNHSNGQIHGMVLTQSIEIPKGSIVSVTCPRIEPKYYVDLYGYSKNYSE